jgi:hypothetical protein
MTTYKLELEDGTPAEPPTFRSLPSDPVPVLVVEDLPGSATSAAA